jgi:hypothetical protein
VGLLLIFNQRVKATENAVEHWLIVDPLHHAPQRLYERPVKSIKPLI